MIERVTSFADLITLLNETKTPHRADLQRQVVEIPTTAPPLTGPMVVRWEKALPYAQIIQVMVEGVPPARVGDVEHAICRANNTVALPGFGYAVDQGFIYMRLCVPIYEDGMSTSGFRRQMASTLSNARQFASPFQKVVHGEPGDRILALAVAEATAS
jgi:hypothetical protein